MSYNIYQNRRIAVFSLLLFFSPSVNYFPSKVYKDALHRPIESFVTPSMAAMLRKLKKFLSFWSTSKADPNRAQDTAEPDDNVGSSVLRRARSSASTSSFTSRLSRSFSHLPSKKTCVICLRTLRSGHGEAIFTAECSHTYHFNCIMENIVHGNLRCPICRAEWKEIPFQATSNVPDLRQNNFGRARVSPYNGSPVDVYAFGSCHDPLPSNPPHLEPDIFSDDEALPTITAAPDSSCNSRSITLKAFPEYEAVSTSDFVSKFAVLVRVTAPPLHNDAQCLNRAPVDLVLVLDLSGSMSSKLSLLRQAVHFIIQNLGPSDRLSLVTFSSTAKRIVPLRRMYDSGREDAINAVNCLFCCGGTNIVEGLKKGIRVLEERRERNPVASITLLSDGKDTYSLSSKNQCNSEHNPDSSNPSQKLDYVKLLLASICCSNAASRDEPQQPIIPVHTFGFGSQHDSTTMHAIADASGGTFSFIESIDILQDAFARCIGGLLSVVAQDLRITIKSVAPGVNLGSIPSIPVSSDVEGEQRSKPLSLLDLCCSHKSCVSMETVQVEGERVHILRPAFLSPMDKVVCLEVDRQKNRLLVAEAIANAQAMAELRDLNGAQAMLAEQRSALSTSASAQAGDALCNWLEAELREIQERMTSVQLYEQTGRAYALSGLSSHSRQRATTRGQTDSNTNTTTSYETPSMVSMVSKSQVLNLAHGAQPRLLNKSSSLSQTC
ncbi:putative Zinc finger family protein [Tripterygium wilfordii]|uniref:Putative Zinc finger family protein n=1 Tax=Tripterygium wilfordii TaxID=458696 RepID=A0A7J7CQ52_TRIWF|nr:E3 ubiquitin-protein ligase WAV3-like [Tripterygium wilfordii]KAF5736232.1 putative Zinc finger family protein [Tripterygium wilfordii]